MAEPPRVTVVCVTYNSAELLPDFVEALHKGLQQTSWALISVDNASQDQSADRLQALLPSARIVRSPTNDGFAAGINRGIRVAESDQAILIINPDARLHAGSVARMLVEAQRPGVGIVAPRLLDADGTTYPSLWRESTVLRVLAAAVLGDRLAGRVPGLGELLVGGRIYDHPRDVVWASGAVLLFAAGLVERVGLLDESFFLYSEETEFALRTRDAGYHVRYCPDAVATHLGGDSNASPQLYRMLIGNKLRLYSRLHPRWQSRLYRRAMIVHQIVRARLGREMAPHGLAALRDRTLLDG